MNAGSLGFSVTVYTICAITTITILMLRRCLGVFGKTELGGPTVPKYISAGILVTLWVLYVVLSSLQTYGKIGSI